MSLSTLSFAKLNGTNYSSWVGDMKSFLHLSGVWRNVSGDSKHPEPSSPPASDHPAKLEAWLEKHEKVAGIIYAMVEHDQKVHFSGIDDDPVKMWAKLAEVHMQKKPGTRFNAYDDLFSIRKQEDESLQTLINRVDQALRTIKDLRPADFTLDKLDAELASMALIRALPEEYNTFVSSLLLQDKLEKDAITQAFVTEDMQ